MPSLHRTSYTLVAVMLLANTAVASDPIDAPPTSPPTAPRAPQLASQEPSSKPSLVDPEMRKPWSTESARGFVGMTIDAGFLYLRPRVQVGYGRPHSTWVGLEGNPLATGQGFGAYGGARIAVPHADLRVGTRYFRAYNHEYLVPAQSYDRLTLDSTLGTVAHAVTHEAEANADVPLGPGRVLLLGSLSYVTDVPRGYWVFEETLRVVVDPPWVWRARGGYSLGFGERQQASIAWVVDVLGVPDRNTTVVRTGPLLRFMLSRSFELRGSFVAAIHSPDHLGLLDGDFTEFGVRWCWATDELSPVSQGIRQQRKPASYVRKLPGCAGLTKPQLGLLPP